MLNISKENARFYAKIFVINYRMDIPISMLNFGLKHFHMESPDRQNYYFLEPCKNNIGYHVHIVVWWK